MIVLFKKLNQTKVFRDPLYGNIPIEYQMIQDLINTREVQRLRRIRQLSGVAMVFHTAEHSRFGHSLGTYYIAHRMINEVEDISSSLNEYERIVFLVSALLHDIGHGPFSHAFENVFGIKHEIMTCKMIEDEKTQINSILNQYPGLVDDVVGVISHNGKYPIIESLISSQLDVDRLDYLNRDAHQTGATYGVVDVDRIIRIISVKNGQICYKEKGIHAIENYLMSRYHMYWQVYYHPVARSYEVILESIYARIKEMLANNIPIEADVSSLEKVFFNQDLEAYIDIDDTYVNGIIKQLTKSNDAILSDLCDAFMDRRLFSYLHLKNADTDDKALLIKKQYLSSPILYKYYYKEDEISQVTYLNYLNCGSDIDVNNILILLDNGDLQPIDEYSPIVGSLLQSGQKKEKKIFYGRPKSK